MKERLIEPEGIVIDAKSGVTGAGRGSASAFGYAETNEDVFAYGLASHPHVPEIETALAQRRRRESERRLHAAPRADVAWTACDLLRAAA